MVEKHRQRITIYHNFLEFCRTSRIISETGRSVNLSHYTTKSYAEELQRKGLLKIEVLDERHSTNPREVPHQVTKYTTTEEGIVFLSLLEPIINVMDS